MLEETSETSGFTSGRYGKNQRATRSIRLLFCVFFSSFVWSSPAAAPNATGNGCVTDDENVGQAAELLSKGMEWQLVPEPMRRAFANRDPKRAVCIGGADALNLIDPEAVSPELVKGYVKIDGAWVKSSLVIGTEQLNNREYTDIRESVKFFDVYRQHYSWGDTRVTEIGEAALVWNNGDKYTLYVTGEPLGPAVPVATVSAYYGPYGTKLWSTVNLGAPISRLDENGNPDTTGQSGMYPTYAHGVVVQPSGASTSNTSVLVKTKLGSSIHFIKQ